MVSYYHQVYSHTVFSLTHSPIHVIPVNTSMVSYYHQVYPLTALRELVFPLTLPWCRTTTKSSLTALRELVLPLTLRWCRTTTKSSLTPTPILVLPLTSFHLILATNASQMHHKCITNHLPHSPTHHASITSSSPHHLFLSPTTTNRFLSLHTTLLTPPFHSQPSQSSPKSSPISIHTHSSPRRTPWTTQQHQTNSIKKMG